MRLFVSIQLPEPVIEQIIRIEKVLLSQDLFIGTRVKPEQLHSTLLFLGNKDEQELSEIIQKLATIKYSQFIASLGTLEVNSWRHPHVLWLTLCSPLLHELTHLIHTCLGYQEERAFKPHITLFRLKKILATQKLQEIIHTITIEQNTWIVTEFTLQQSELHTKGTRYTVLESFKLTI